MRHSQAVSAPTSFPTEAGDGSVNWRLRGRWLVHPEGWGIRADLVAVVTDRATHASRSAFKDDHDPAITPQPCDAAAARAAARRRDAHVDSDLPSTALIKEHAHASPPTRTSAPSRACRMGRPPFAIAARMATTLNCGRGSSGS
jgi:hypothetical protein